jgi:hypothetical protein
MMYYSKYIKKPTTFLLWVSNKQYKNLIFYLFLIEPPLELFTYTF